MHKGSGRGNALITKSILNGVRDSGRISGTVVRVHTNIKMLTYDGTQKTKNIFYFFFAGGTEKLQI